MAQDSRNQLQSQRVRMRDWRWCQLFELLGVSERLAERPEVAAKMREIEEQSFTIWLNQGW